MRSIGVFICLQLAHTANARNIEIRFQSAESVDTTQTTAVVNRVSQKAHLPYIVDRNNNGTDSEDDELNIGFGGDGAFDSTTAKSFDVNGGSNANLVTLDSTRVYEFTSLSIPTGLTVKAQGSSVLRLRVQGNVDIRGTIDLSGQEGESPSSSATTARAGGSACCGGGAGGNGGVGSSDANSGTSADSSNTGRGRAGTSGSTAGGGGGGGHSGAGTAGLPNPQGGASGSSYGGNFITTLVGGSGGGGGGFKTGTGAAAGGGGGGGGGVLSLHVGGDVAISSTGSILAKGGKGGGTTSSLLAGGGGGGAGGSVLIFVAGRYTNNGTVDASQGTGGGTTGNAANGGAGSDGRLRIVPASGTLEGSPISETPPFAEPENGQIFYTKLEKQIYTTVFDSGLANAEYDNFVIDSTSPSGTTITTEFAASNDNFASDTTRFQPLTSLSLAKNHRYFRLRFTLKTTSRSTTPEVRSVSFRVTQPGFEFGLASCGAVHGQRGSRMSLLFIVLWITPLLALGRRYQRLSSKRRQPLV